MPTATDQTKMPRQPRQMQKKRLSVLIQGTDTASILRVFENNLPVVANSRGTSVQS